MPSARASAGRPLTTTLASVPRSRSRIRPSSASTSASDQVALAHLDEADAARDRRLDDVDQVPAPRLPPVRHQHETRQRVRRRLAAGARQRSGSRPVRTRPAMGLEASA